MEAQLALPAYEQVLKAAHTFNLLDARGAISVTERAGVHRAHPHAREGGGAELLRIARAPGIPDAEWTLSRPLPRRGRSGRLMSEKLLVELLCEELPPKALKRLGDAFAEGIAKGLQKRSMLDAGSVTRPFATPRRLAVEISGVKAASEARAMEVKLMPASVGLDAKGKPTPALLKKLEAAGLAGLEPSKLRMRVDGKAEMLFAEATTPAVPLAAALQAALDEAIAQLPIPR